MNNRNKNNGTFESVDVLGGFEIAEEDGPEAIRGLINALNVLRKDLMGWPCEVAGM